MMAREILFKAKRIDNGEWVEGYYGIKGKETEVEQNCIMASTFNSNGKPDFYFNDYVIDKKTICQFTGLLDKNGNKIWENDVVHKADTSALGWCRERICIVSWDKWGYWKITTTFGDGYWIGEFDNEQLEVIGNIFDNPELLVATTVGAE